MNMAEEIVLYQQYHSENETLEEALNCILAMEITNTLPVNPSIGDTVEIPGGRVNAYLYTLKDGSTLYLEDGVFYNTNIGVDYYA